MSSSPRGASCPACAVLLALASLLGGILVNPSSAAEPELVGVLALALEPDAADKIKLSDSQREALLDLVDQRELAGIDIAMAARNLPPAERLEKLAAFREASVQQGLKLLTARQQATLAAMQAESTNPAYAASQAPPAERTDAGRADAEKATAEETVSQSPRQRRASPETAATEEQPPQEQSLTHGATTDGASAGSSDQQAATSHETRPPSDEGPLSFNFRYQPWKDVLDWFADRADLSLVLESAPPGTFNYQDNRKYSIGEALDVLNSVLQTKGYTLVRKGRMLLLVNLEDGIPPNLVTDVPLSKLDERGDYEIVRVLFRVRNLMPDDAAEELEQMLGPQGEILVLPKAGMIQVTETAGRIRTLRSVIEAIEEPGGGDGTVKEFPLQYVTADEALPVLRQMLGIPADMMTTPSGSLQLAVDPLGMKLFAQGSAVQLRRLNEILQLVDVAGAAAGPGVAETPQLEVYPVPGIDPELVLNVLQTILAGKESTRLATDARTGNLVALATPSEHATIRATLDQMQQDQRRVEVIPLDSVDPQLAVLSINKLFSSATTGEEPDPRAPTVDADLTSRSLLVRASPAQISQIKDFLNQLEDGQTSVSTTGSGNVRMLPISPSAARSALGQLEQLWPTLRPNRIRVITPSAAIPAYKPSEGDSAPRDPLEELLGPGSFLGPSSLETPMPAPSAEGDDRSANSGRVRAYFAAQPLGAHEPEPQAEQQDEAESTAPKSRPGAEIIVAPGASGTIIASADLEALDAFEQLLRNTASQSATGGRQFAVFYLKYAEAGKASETLAKVFGASTGGGGGLMDDLAGAALGGLGGGLMGDLLGLGGSGDAAGGFSSTSVDIVPDARLNALVVYAQPADLDMIDQLLRVLDQRAGPEPVEAGGRPRLIPVVNTSAAQVAEVVKQVFQDRIQGGGGNGGQPSPQDLIRALRRGGGGGGGGGGDDQEPTKMSIGVDARSNSLVVRAPDPLFQQVEQLVKQLDEEGVGTPQSTRIVSLQHTNSTALRDTLKSLLGEGAVTTSSGNAEATPNGGERNRDDGDAARETMRRIEMFRRMREGMQQEGGGGRGGREGRGGGERGGGRGGRGGGGGGGRGGGGDR